MIILDIKATRSSSSLLISPPMIFEQTTRVDPKGIMEISDLINMFAENNQKTKLKNNQHLSTLFKGPSTSK